MNAASEIRMDALIAEGGMPVSAGQAAVRALKLMTEQMGFSADGLYLGNQSIQPIQILVSISDETFEIVPGRLYFVDGFLSKVTLNGQDWIPPRTGPLGPIMLHMVVSDPQPDPSKPMEIPANDHGIVELKGMKCYFAEGKLVKRTNAVPVKVRVTEALRNLPVF